MTRISVVMCVYNCEDTVKKSIDSIISQTYSDWFFIICDDGSNDETIDIIKEFSKQYPNKFLILQNQTNKGLTYSLTRCLKYVKTEFIARMDGDDISLPERFKRQVEFLDSNSDISFVGCAIEYFDEKTTWRNNHLTEFPSNKSFLWDASFCHPSIMIRTSALEKVNGYRDRWFTKRCEDYDLWMRLYANGMIGYNIQEVLFRYYEGQHSVHKRKFRFRICEFIVRIQGYYKLKLYPLGLFYIWKPIFVGLIPGKMLLIIRKKNSLVTTNKNIKI